MSDLTVHRHNNIVGGHQRARENQQSETSSFSNVQFQRVERAITIIDELSDSSDTDFFNTVSGPQS